MAAPTPNAQPEALTEYFVKAVASYLGASTLEPALKNHFEQVARELHGRGYTTNDVKQAISKAKSVDLVTAFNAGLAGGVPFAVTGCWTHLVPSLSHAARAAAIGHVFDVSGGRVLEQTLISTRQNRFLLFGRDKLAPPARDALPPHFNPEDLSYLRLFATYQTYTVRNWLVRTWLPYIKASSGAAYVVENYVQPLLGIPMLGFTQFFQNYRQKNDEGLWVLCLFGRNDWPSIFSELRSSRSTIQISMGHIRSIGQASRQKMKLYSVHGAGNLALDAVKILLQPSTLAKGSILVGGTFCDSLLRSHLRNWLAAAGHDEHLTDHLCNLAGLFTNGATYGLYGMAERFPKDWGFLRTGGAGAQAGRAPSGIEMRTAGPSVVPRRVV